MKWTMDTTCLLGETGNDSSQSFTVTPGLRPCDSTRSKEKSYSAGAIRRLASRWLLQLFTGIFFLYVCPSTSAWDLSITWDQAYPPAVDGWHIYTAKAGDAFSLWGTATTNKFTLTGLLTNTIYRVMVKAFNSISESTNQSNTLTNSGPVVVPPPPSVPQAPTNLRVVAQFPEILNLHWEFDNISEPPATYFILERAMANQQWELAAVVPIETRDGGDQNRKKNTIYYYRLYAANDVARSPYSDIGWARTLQR